MTFREFWPLYLRAHRLPGTRGLHYFATAFGIMATIGRKHAVAEFGRLRIAGFPAWLLWSFAHVYFLIGFRNRFSVALDWTWSYLTFERGARLITGPVSQSAVPAASDGPAKRAA